MEISLALTETFEQSQQGFMKVKVCFIVMMNMAHLEILKQIIAIVGRTVI
jgi:hypothetical protein